MSYLAADLAVFERLVGAPLDSNGRPKTDENGVPVNLLLCAPPLYQPEEVTRLPSYGVRIPMTRQGVDATRGRSTQNPRPFKPTRDFVFGAWRNVPVFPVNIEGRDWSNIWPCVTYYCQDETFNASTFIYADPFGRDAPDAPTIEVTNRRGKVLATGVQNNERRPHPEAYDLHYGIQVYSKDSTELRWICDAVKKLFPARGSIEVEQMDGSRLQLDMLMEGDPVNLDIGNREVAMSMADNEQRHFSRLFTYRIESYIDNTGGFEAKDRWQEYAITNRILELADLQNNLIETVDVEAVEAHSV
jgi:hypothetical protein